MTISALSLIGQPPFVVAATVAALQDCVATLETIRANRAVDPAQSLAVAAALTSLFNEIPLQLTNVSVSGACVADLFAAVDLLASALPAAQAVSLFAAALPAFPASVSPSSASPGAVTLAANLTLVNQLSRLALLAGFAQGLLGASFSDRPSAVAARAQAVRLIDREMEVASLNPGGAVYAALASLRAAIVTYFSGTVANLAAVVTIDANVMAPALFWAWRLYADPTRAQEIIDRNRVPHPAFVAARFEALAS